MQEMVINIQHPLVKTSHGWLENGPYWKKNTCFSYDKTGHLFSSQPCLFTTGVFGTSTLEIPVVLKKRKDQSFRTLEIEYLHSPKLGICLRWFFTFYHGKSPLKHHLGEYCCGSSSLELPFVHVVARLAIRRATSSSFKDTFGVKIQCSWAISWLVKLPPLTYPPKNKALLWVYSPLVSQKRPYQTLVSEGGMLRGGRLTWPVIMIGTYKSGRTVPCLWTAGGIPQMVVKVRESPQNAETFRFRNCSNLPRCIFELIYKFGILFFEVIFIVAPEEERWVRSRKSPSGSSSLPNIFALRGLPDPC